MLFSLSKRVGRISNAKSKQCPSVENQNLAPVEPTTVGPKRCMEGAAPTTHPMPRSSRLPVIPHISLRKSWHIRGDRSAVHCSASRQRPFAAQHNHLLKWNWRGANLLFSHLCQDESQSTFGPCSPASNHQLVFSQRSSLDDSEKICMLANLLECRYNLRNPRLTCYLLLAPSDMWYQMPKKKKWEKNSNLLPKNSGSESWDGKCSGECRCF